MSWGVPKIYFAAYKDEGEIYKYECIDGKQRLTTVFDFLDNKFSIKINGSDKFYRNLNLDIQEKFADYSFCVEIAEDFKNEELSDLFIRLQSGLVLNTSEKLKAVPGEMSELIYKLSKHKLFEEKIKSKARRNPHLATVAQVSLLSIKNDIVNLKFKDLKEFLKKYIAFNTNGEEAKKIKYILNYIDKNFSEKEAREVFTSRAMFVSCFYLIAYCLLRGDISKLKIKKFFINFVKKLSLKKKDNNLKDFQISIIQSADSSTSIRKRHEILVADLIKFDKNASSLLNYKTLEDEFRLVYKKKLGLFNGSHGKLNEKLINLKCKELTKTDGTIETLPVYIRHSNEHPNKKRTYRYNLEDLKYSIFFLKKITKNNN